MKDFKDKDTIKYEQNIIVGIRQYIHRTLENRLEAKPYIGIE